MPNDEDYINWYSENRMGSSERNANTRYLYLNFMENLEHGSRRSDDFFTDSLTEQYDLLKPRLGYFAYETLQQFIARVFPVVEKYYYISLPGFDRGIRSVEDRSGNKHEFINNIVVRPRRDFYLDQALPKNYDVIIIGDVTFGKVISITVKGIELIDVNVAKFGEMEISCAAVCAFSKKSLPNGFHVPDYGRIDLYSPVLTYDLIEKLGAKFFPVPDPGKAIKELEKWQHYIDFRRYYLNEQSKKGECIASVTVCDSYMITKNVYRKNEESLSWLLLDGVEDFAKGDQVILSRAVDGAEGFPLIRVDIDRNRKDALREIVGKNGRKSKYESRLRRYTKESMGLAPSEFKDDNKEYSNAVKEQYPLGERYLFTYTDIEPDMTDLEKIYEKELAAANKQTDNKYEGIIRGELEKYIVETTVELRAKYDGKLEEYRAELAAALDSDVAENKDMEVKNEYDAQVAKLLAPTETSYRKRLSETKDKDKASALRIRLEEERKRVKESVSLRGLYITRNTKRVENRQKALESELKAELERVKEEKLSQLRSQYEGSISKEKSVARDELQRKFKADKDERIENDTVRRYSVYFRPTDVMSRIAALRNDIGRIKPAYLVYDKRAENAKIERQQKALNSFRGGYVKNPYLAAYLFAPETLKDARREVAQDPEWCLESLNDRQRLAVKRALASESLFLLQGPPGTGKTQVIAEITAQLAKRGKKILISSETHKAIDNVFERLPKIPEIRPLRLIPSQSGKETNYSPERLVDNFYANISGNLERQISKFEHFEETKATFDEEMKKLRLDYDKLLRMKQRNAKVDSERKAIADEVSRLNDELQRLRDELAVVREKLEEHRRTVKHIENHSLSKDGTVERYIEDYAGQLGSLLSEFESLAAVPAEKVGDVVGADTDKLAQELSQLLSDDVAVELQKRRRELKLTMAELLSDDGEAPQEGQPGFVEYKKCQSELIDIGKKIDAAKSASSFDMPSSIIAKLFPAIVGDKTLLKKLPEELAAFKSELRTLIAKMKAAVEKAMSAHTKKEGEISQEIGRLQLEISENKRRYEELGENADIEEYSELNAMLRQKITRFFRDFDIVKEYDTANLEEAFDIIGKEWAKLERDYKKSQKENQNKISTYRSIVKYLSQEDILEDDRQEYTRALFDRVNVFGITCTSRDKFTKNQLEELEKYGIESVDIRSQGIDVVIIDEVSKSSFLDLLIPILYGKTVILVGDHRQLPPMYDLRHMRGSDFDGLDPDIITEEINKKFTELYETCFFKTLYEGVPDEFKIMLNKQYRCHSHIMEVFNHFYGGSKKGLIVGRQQQDDEKAHGLTVRINGNTVIDPEHHVYFVDCEEWESSSQDSTSKINEQEANVTITLLRELNNAAAELVKSGKLRVDKDKKLDERPSVGVICTYGDQAGLIRRKRKHDQFKGFSEKPDEKPVISTVDDFQGDERDVIIVSMVRNPAHGRNYDAEFIKKFERINVALSRARKMLIIVGSRRFLSTAGVIDLPDMDGKGPGKENFCVYKEIIDTIAFRGKVLPASDIIGD